MLKKVRLVVLGVLMAGILGYACIGINAATVFACEGSQGSSACGAGKKEAPCDITKELGLTPEQIVKFEKLKAECERNRMQCGPECFQKFKAILTHEQGKKLEVFVAKQGGNPAALAKREGAPQVK
ncbi:MAG: hypothetical protein ACUZ77_04325 [Candidatus Brocadiales bacterium]